MRGIVFAVIVGVAVPTRADVDDPVAKVAAADADITSAAKRGDLVAASIRLDDLCEAFDTAVEDEGRRRPEAKALASLAWRTAVQLARSGYYERAYRAALCRLGATATDKAAQRAVLGDVESMLDHWLADDAPDALALRRALGTSAWLVSAHMDQRAAVVLERACIRGYARTGAFDACETGQRVARVQAVLSGIIYSGIEGYVGDAVVLGSRLDLGLVPTAATADALATIADRYERRWADPAVGVTARWLRALAKLAAGDAPTEMLVDETYKHQKWFAQLLLVRGRLYRDRGQLTDATDDTSNATRATHDPLAVLEHAENLRASGRLRETELILDELILELIDLKSTGFRVYRRFGKAEPILEIARRNYGHHTCSEGAGVGDRAARRARYVAEAETLGRDGPVVRALDRFADDLRHCRATNPNVVGPAIVEAAKKCVGCDYTDARAAVAKYGSALRGGRDLDACDRTLEAVGSLLRSEDTNAAIAHDLSVTYYAEGRYANALEWLDLACGMDRVQLLASRAGVLLALDRLDDADEVLEHAMILAEHVTTSDRVRVLTAARIRRNLTVLSTSGSATGSVENRCEVLCSRESSTDPDCRSAPASMSRQNSTGSGCCSAGASARRRPRGLGAPLGPPSRGSRTRAFFCRQESASISTT